MVGFLKKERKIGAKLEPKLCLVFKPFPLQGKKGMPSLSHVAYIIVSSTASGLIFTIVCKADSDFWDTLDLKSSLINVVKE